MFSAGACPQFGITVTLDFLFVRIIRATIGGVSTSDDSPRRSMIGHLICAYLSGERAGSRMSTVSAAEHQLSNVQTVLTAASS